MSKNQFRKLLSKIKKSALELKRDIFNHRTSETRRDSSFKILPMNSYGDFSHRAAEFTYETPNNPKN